MPIMPHEFVNSLMSIPEGDRQRYVDMLKSGQASVPFSPMFKSPQEMGFKTNPNPEPTGFISQAIWRMQQAQAKNSTPAQDQTPVPRMNFVANRRIAGPSKPVETKSQAYKNGGLVRGCGKAVRGHGKVKVY